MRGVQFLTDDRGKKTAALVNLKEHSAFWADVLEEDGISEGFQFLSDEQGEKIAVLLEFDRHGELWEDVYDGLTTEDIEDEPSIPWEKVERELMEKSHTVLFQRSSF